MKTFLVDDLNLTFCNKKSGSNSTQLSQGRKLLKEADIILLSRTDLKKKTYWSCPSGKLILLIVQYLHYLQNIQLLALFTIQITYTTKKQKIKKKMKKYLLYKYGKMGLHLKGEKIKAFKFTIVGIFTLLQQSQM